MYSIFIDHLINPGGKMEEGVQIVIEKDIVHQLKTGVTPSKSDIIFKNSICSTGLINSHDHLKYTWYKHIGNPPYKDSYSWLPTLYEEAKRLFLNKIHIEDLYWLGIYKNIFSGVTTVVNHCRYLPKEFFDKFSVNYDIYQDFYREIYIDPPIYTHLMGAGANDESRLAKENKKAFVLHLAEGLNTKTSLELKQLEDMGGLFDGTVIIHGINLSSDDLEKICLKKASIVICPTSNLFLFQKLGPIHEILKLKINISIGTDSTCTGDYSIFNEIRCVKNHLIKKFNYNYHELNTILHSMVTRNGAKAMKTSNIGEIAVGKKANLLIFENVKNDPFESFTSLETYNIISLIYNGEYLLTQLDMKKHLQPMSGHYTKITINNKLYSIFGDPYALFTKVSKLCGVSVNDFNHMDITNI